MDHDGQEHAEGVHHEVLFPPLDPRASVGAAGTSHLGGLHGLAVDDGGAGAFGPAVSGRTLVRRASWIVSQVPSRRPFP